MGRQIKKTLDEQNPQDALMQSDSADFLMQSDSEDVLMQNASYRSRGKSPVVAERNAAWSMEKRRNLLMR
ncbi:MAG: hypothetical protein GX939_07330 [Clostridiaceae bacterium]|jgi:hypothetical protein|nr:hypothetical protein [Clostridiaceae bacterium]